MPLILSWCFVLAFIVRNAYSGNVLFLPASISASHKLPLRIWAEALLQRGHEIYWWSPSAKLDHYQPQPNDKMHVNHYEVDVNDQFLMDAFRYENASFIHDLWWNSRYSMPFIETLVSYQLTPFCESVIVNHRKSFEDVISRKYDLIIVDEILNPCGLLVAQLAEGPVTTYISTSTQTKTATKSNGLPVPYAYYPSMSDLFVPTDRMNFFLRVHTMFSWMLGYAGDHYFYRSMTKTLQKHIPQLTNVREGLIRPHLQFLSVPQLLDFVLPLARNSIYMGGLQLPKHVEPLKDDYKEFIRLAKKGFIVLSFGHWGDWNAAPEDMRQSFLDAFKMVPGDYSIIWQYNGPQLNGLPKNVFPSKWIPLSSLLAEPSCRLLITHCGCNSLTETGEYGVPVLAIPLSADQPDGAARSISKGFGVLVKKNHITADNLLKGIMEVLQNDSYSKNIKKYSRLQKSLPLTPEAATIFWSEFIMKHHSKKGGIYYRTSSAALLLHWFQFYCLDIVFLFTSLVLFAFYLVFKMLYVLKRRLT